MPMGLRAQNSRIYLACRLAGEGCKTSNAATSGGSSQLHNLEIFLEYYPASGWLLQYKSEKIVKKMLRLRSLARE